MKGILQCHRSELRGEFVLWYRKAVCRILDDYDNCASEASPTLGCSIEILCDIYIYIYVCRSVCLRLSMGNPHKKMVCQNAWEELRGPSTHMLKVSFVSLKHSAACKS